MHYVNSSTLMEKFEKICPSLPLGPLAFEGAEYFMGPYFDKNYVIL